MDQTLQCFQASLDVTHPLFTILNVIDKITCEQYQCKIPWDYLISKENLKQILDSQKYKIIFDNQSGIKLELCSSPSIQLGLYLTNFKPLIKVGKLEEIEQLLQKYPGESFKFYAKHNHQLHQPIQILTWNTGIRVTFKDFYLQGDNGSSLDLGNALFTKNTSDDKSKQGFFYHRYVKQDGTEYGSNGNANNLEIFVKRR